MLSGGFDLPKKTRYYAAISLILLASIPSQAQFELISAASAAQTIPKLLNYQARITSATGTAVADGSLSVQFTIYDASASGTCRYTTRGSCGAPTAKTVTVTNGVFSTLLGDTAGGDNAIPDDLFDTPTLYLGITVATDSEMTPRKRLSAAPWAFNADRLDNLDTSATGGTTAFIPVTSATGSLSLSADLNVGGTGSFGNLTVTGTCTGCGGGASTLQQAYDNSTSPEFTLDATRGAVTIRDAATPLGTANLFEIKDFIQNTTHFLVSASGVRIGGANLDTTAATFNIATTATTINLAAAATTINFGGGSGSTGCTVDGSGNYTCTGDGAFNGGDITTTATTATLFNTAATTVSVGGAATTFNMAGGSGSTGCTINSSGDLTCTGDMTVTGGDIISAAATFNLAAGSTTVNLAGGSGSTGCTISSAGDLTCTGSITGGGGGTTLQQAYNNSTTPEITLDATRGALTIRDAASTIGGNLLEVKDFTQNNGYLTVSATSVQSTAGNSLLFSGTAGLTPTSGAGTRLMWIPAKFAFRAGRVSGTQWNDANVGEGSVAFGDGNTASGADSAAFGLGTEASGGGSIAYGVGTIASNGAALAGGDGTAANGYASVAFGENTSTTGVGAMAGGSGSDANGSYSIAWGSNALTTGNRSFAFGDTVTAAQDAFAIGTLTSATGSNAFSMGDTSRTGGINSFAGGFSSTAAGTDSFAFGARARADGAFSVAFGQDVLAAAVGAGNTYVFGKGVSSVSPIINDVANSFMIGFNSTTPTLTVRGLETSGTPTLLRVIGQAHTGLSAGQEVVDVNFALNRTVQRATGAVATQRAFLVQAPTYSFVGGSTITNAATLAVSGAPVAGTNATITNSYALWVQGGTTRLGGNVIIDGTCTGCGGGTLQSAYTASTGGATPEITLDSTRGALTIVDASSPTGANYFEILNRHSNTPYLAVSSTNTLIGNNTLEFPETTAIQKILIGNSTGISIIQSQDAVNGIGFANNLNQNAYINFGYINYGSFTDSGASTPFGSDFFTFSSGQNRASGSALVALTDSGTPASGSSMLELTGAGTTGTGINLTTNTYTTGTGMSLSMNALTTGKMLNLFGGSAMTTGNIINVATATFATPGGGIGRVFNLNFANIGTGAGTNIVEGIVVNSQMNLFDASAGSKFTVGIDIPSPIITNCRVASSSDCVWIGMSINGSVDNNITHTTNDELRITDLSIGGETNLTQSGLAGTITYKGIRLSMPSVTQTTGSVTATGLEISGGNGGGTSYAITTEIGNVGFGVTNPAVQLHVAASEGEAFRLSTGDAFTYMAFNQDATRKGIFGWDSSGSDLVTGGPADSIVLRSQAGIVFAQGGDNLSMVLSTGNDLDINGDLTVDLNNAVTTNGVCHSGGASNVATTNRSLVVCNGAGVDVAEFYPTVEGLHPDAGELLVTGDQTLTYSTDAIDPYTGMLRGRKDAQTVSRLDRSRTPYDARIIGVVTTSPDKTLGRSLIDVTSSTAPIALVGRVPVKVNDRNGPIRIGDPITTSAVPGIGMKATGPGMIVGTALSAWDGPGQGMVMVFINVGWHGENAAIGAKRIDDAPIVALPEITALSASGTPSVTPIASLASSNGLWSISEEGLLVARKIETDILETGKIMMVQSATATSISEGTVPKGKTSVTIKNAAMTKGAKVFVSFLADSNGNTWITDKGDGTFTLHLKTAPKKDLPFEYWIIGVDDQRPKP